MTRLSGWIWGLAIAAAFMGQALAQERKDLVLRGDAVCTRCHNDGDEFPVLAIGKTKHGTVADGRTPSCTNCHGESNLHVNRPPDAKERPKPDRSFGKNSKTPMAERSGACLTCHQGNTRMHWQLSAHAGNEVSCTSCHQVHTQHDRVRDRVTQTDVCFTCHKEQRAQLRRPSRHPIAEGKVACSDCHNPHGTTNPSLLKVRPPFLCQSCHEPDSHHSTIPNNGRATLPPGASTNQAVIMARGCVNCHTNIHGSNNPTDGGGGRGFRR